MSSQLNNKNHDTSKIKLSITLEGSEFSDTVFYCSEVDSTPHDPEGSRRFRYMCPKHKHAPRVAEIFGHIGKINLENYYRTFANQKKFSDIMVEDAEYKLTVTVDGEEVSREIVHGAVTYNPHNSVILITVQ